MKYTRMLVEPYNVLPYNTMKNQNVEKFYTHHISPYEEDMANYRKVKHTCGTVV